jgi:predicted kinase
MNFDKPDRLDILPQQGLTAPPGTLAENLTTAFDVARFNGGSGSNSKAFTMLEIWGPIVDLANENGGDFENPGMYLAGSLFDASSPRLYEKVSQDIYSWMAQNKDTLPPELQDITPDVINQRTKDFVQSKENELAELARTNPDLASAAARFIGSMGTAFGDPVTQATMPFGGWSKSLWKNVMQNAAINAGAGAITEVDVKKWYDELGLEYGYDDFLKNVAIQGAFGAALPVAGRGIQMTAAQAKKGWEVLSGKGRKPISPEDQALVDVLEAQEEVVASNPLETPQDPNVAEFEHQSRLTKAQAAIENNMAPNITPEPNAPVKPAVAAGAADNLDGVIFKYNPDEIGIDAKTFQFKSGGDEFGVTERLQDAVWDKNLAGTITVYEYADGRVVVSDGHQRLGLAKRIKAQDPSQEITLYAYKDREVDGISPAESRVSSAIKNIANAPKDSYDPQLVIDAAKVLREATNNPNISVDIISSLPPRSQVVKQAQGMMLLGDDAFMAIINGVIPPNYAAIVGNLIDNPELQSAAISVLAKASPGNAFEAEAIIRQVRESDFEQVKQIDLFGEQIVTESYFVERAKILDKAYKELRKDKAAFETLVRNSDRLEAEGNVLVKDANKRKADTDGQTIALLQTLANRKGPLSDALNQAARTARDTNSYVEATRGFLDSVRGSIESGDFERLSSGDIGRAVDGTPQISRSEIEREPALEGFDEPTGIASERQADQLIDDMFGSDEVDVDSVAGLKRLLDESPTRDQIENHPSVIKALDDMEARPETIGLEGYNTEAWHNSRVYKIDDQDVISTAEAMARFELDAEQLAFKELGIDPQPVLRNKELTIVLGPPASGKSTIANELAIANKSAILDSDEIKKALPEYEGGIGAAATHEESSDLAKILQSLMIEQGTNIVLPKVGHTASSIRKVISLYKDKGYKVRIVNMDVTPENAFQRMIRRFVSSGRIIPPVYLDRVGSNPSATYRTLKQEGVADGYAEIDNNGGFNDPKEIKDISGDNPLFGSSFDVPAGGRTGPDAIRRAERDSAEYSLEKTQPSPDGGIADDINTSDIFDDMDLEVPLGERIDPETGDVLPATMTLRDLKAQMDQEDAMINRLEFCTI